MVISPPPRNPKPAAEAERVRQLSQLLDSTTPKAMALRSAAGTAARGVGSLRQHSLVATRAGEVFLPKISAACSPFPSGFRFLSTKDPSLTMIQDAVQEGLKSDALKLVVQAAVDEGLKSQDALKHTIELAVQKALKFDVEGPTKAQAMGVYSASSSADPLPKSDAAYSTSGYWPADPLPKSTSAYCLSGSRVSRSADLLIKSSAAYCPCLSRVSRSLVLIPKTSAGYFSSVSRTCFLPLSGPRFFSTQKGCADLDKFDKFEKLYQKDRVHVSTGLDRIVGLLYELKEDVDQTDFIQKWLTNIGKETLLLSDSQIEGIGKGWTCLNYGGGFFAWGTLVYFGVMTIRENNIPYTDYFHLLNAVRVQALNRGIAQYKAEKQELEDAVNAKAVMAALAKKAAEDAAAEKKAKDVEAAASRKAKAEQTGAKWRSKSEQAAALRKAKAREVRDANLTKWKQSNAERKEADTARKAKAAQAAAEIKAKLKEAAEKRMAKAEKLAAAVAAARKAKAAAKSGPKK